MLGSIDSVKERVIEKSSIGVATIMTSLVAYSVDIIFVKKDTVLQREFINTFPLKIDAAIELAELASRGN